MESGERSISSSEKVGITRDRTLPIRELATDWYRCKTCQGVVERYTVSIDRRYTIRTIQGIMDRTIGTMSSRPVYARGRTRSLYYLACKWAGARHCQESILPGLQVAERHGENNNSTRPFSPTYTRLSQQ